MSKLYYITIQCTGGEVGTAGHSHSTYLINSGQDKPPFCGDFKIALVSIFFPIGV